MKHVYTPIDKSSEKRPRSITLFAFRLYPAAASGRGVGRPTHSGVVMEFLTDGKVHGDSAADWYAPQVIVEK